MRKLTKDEEQELKKGMRKEYGIRIIILVLFIAFLVFIAIIAPRWRGAAWISPTFSAIHLLSSVISWAYIVTILLKRRADSVLLDLGRTKWHKIMLVLAGLNAFEAISSLVSSGIGMEGGSSSLFRLSLSALFFFLGLGHLEIKETGISYFGRVLKWKRIESYGWMDHTLMIKVRRRLLFSRTFRLPIPSVHKSAVDSLLARYVSDATNEVVNGI